MERIQPALEIIKQRGGIHLNGDPPASKNGAVEKIVYTRTRSIEVSLSALRERRILAAVEEAPFTDAYKILRTQVSHRMRENGWNVLGVTSPGRGEGKTLTAVNLAVSMAQQIGQTVLLVDADLRAPGVGPIFEAGEDRGLVDYLLDDIPIEALLVHPGIGRFVFLPGGRPIQSSAELLASPKMRALVEELKLRYQERIVLFDLPPLLAAADALAFSPYLDAVLLVVESGRTQAEDLERALQLLKEVPVIGTVLNRG